jgi:acetoin utilization deacetylase AcuC-like enzyme
METPRTPTIRDYGLLSRRDFIKGLGAAGLLSLWPGGRRTGAGVPDQVGLIFDDIYFKHDTGAFAYENAGRLKAIWAGIEEIGLLPRLHRIAPRRAETKWVETVHDPEYIDTVKKDVASGERQLSTGHTLISRDSYDVALWAVGGVLAACDDVMAGKSPRAFCAVRPPGHHASANCGMGFCIFNNAAVAARYLQRKYGLQRILIVDWDVHHGNGTQDIFYRDGGVFYFSTHQCPWYPWTGAAEETGEGDGKGATLNVPLPAGSGDSDLIEAFNGRLRPAMDRFRPQFILISAGFDSRTADPLGRFRLTDAGFAKLTEILMEIAADHSGGRLVSALEGGYSLEGLSNAVSAHLRALLGT